MMGDEVSRTSLLSLHVSFFVSGDDESYLGRSPESLFVGLVVFFVTPLFYNALMLPPPNKTNMNLRYLQIFEGQLPSLFL